MSGLLDLLIKIDADISTWEHALDIIEEARWNEQIVIKRDVIDELQVVKILTILSEDKFKVTSETIEDLIGLT
tara:strand:- start:1179 stop:1397 length:219 start_codon:yes stop_codon:yes gene_type:complete